MINKIRNSEPVVLILECLDDSYRSVCSKRLRRDNDRIAYLNERQRTWNFIEMIRQDND